MTLFTSQNDGSIRRGLLRTARNYLLITLFTAFFGAVYEYFSFGVYSAFMLYAFAVPLVFGVLPFLLLGMRIQPPGIPPLAGRCWHTGTAALTIGCLVKGVLDIYGTESPLIPVYWAAGGVSLLAGILIRAAAGKRQTGRPQMTGQAPQTTMYP